jgi:hypothetical protein
MNRNDEAHTSQQVAAVEAEHLVNDSNLAT